MQKNRLEKICQSRLNLVPSVFCICSPFGFLGEEHFVDDAHGNHWDNWQKSLFSCGHASLSEALSVRLSVGPGIRWSVSASGKVEKRVFWMFVRVRGVMQGPTEAYTTYTNYRGPDFRGARRALKLSWK